MVRELAFKREADDELAVATLTQEINVIISVLSAYADRSPLGMTVANSLQQLLADPDSCHPANNGSMSSCQGSVIRQTIAKDTPSGDPTSASTSQGPTTPGEMFSGLLWELEQPEIELEQSERFKTMEGDLRAVLGPSFEQVLPGAH